MFYLDKDLYLERQISQDEDFLNTEADLSLENLLEDYLTFETDPKQRKNLEKIYFQAERHQNVAMAMGEYDYQRGLKPDRRLAANEWKPMSLFLIKYPLSIGYLREE
ncbi:MAG: hypothetical protein QNJ54_36900 [Prochloraceae cyanobacterium]|nr:hypothetical protein [Prochloraceae cyanobacterium]